MNSNDFKIHCEGMLKGLNSISNQAISNLKRSYANSSKEDLQKFEEALKSSNVEEMVKKNAETIFNINKNF